MTKPTANHHLSRPAGKFEVRGDCKPSVNQVQPCRPAQYLTHYVPVSALTHAYMLKYHPAQSQSPSCLSLPPCRSLLLALALALAQADHPSAVLLPRSIFLKHTAWSHIYNGRRCPFSSFFVSFLLHTNQTILTFHRFESVQLRFPVFLPTTTNTRYLPDQTQSIQRLAHQTVSLDPQPLSHNTLLTFITKTDIYNFP